VIAIKAPGILSRLDFIEEIVKRIKPPDGRVLNLGCKATRLGDVNVDIRADPEVKATALVLPFKDNSFSLVVFSEVLEHLPPGTELQALREIYRVSQPGGILLLSTPSADGVWGRLYTVADPAFWIIGHRHYSERVLRCMLQRCGFIIHWWTKRGGPRDMLFSIVTPFAFVLSKIGHPRYPNVKSDYSNENGRTGYTVVIQAEKVPSERKYRTIADTSFIAHSRR
jgi:SAM-dependent methyltransferase